LQNGILVGHDPIKADPIVLENLVKFGFDLD